MEIHIVPILKDNYAYVIQTDTEVAIVDPGEAKPVVEFLTKQQLQPNWIINTHKHWDHVNGNLELMEAYDCNLAAPAECEGHIDVVLRDGAVFALGDLVFQIILTKGHTAGHIILFEPNEKIMFSGDTLFAMGCGRLFEGSPSDMFVAMEKIKSLPVDTKIFAGHEYTLSNAKFAKHLLPDNHYIAKRYEVVKQAKCTMPTTLEQELKTNPYLLADSVQQFAKYRAAKDKF